jgi:oligopeptide/dipeptide ABC transporter ATP-binding protein
MGAIRLEHLSKAFAGGVVAVDDVTLTIADGEFMVLVGPSGCGKSTLLRMIAGLEGVSGGTIHIGDRDVTEVAPRSRDIAMVFQNYALYPNMRVWDNLAFALKLRRTPKPAMREKVGSVAGTLGLSDLTQRKPGALSGGQRQRVAIARAIAPRPDVLVCDEPVSALDVSVQAQVLNLLSDLQQQRGLSYLFIAHDLAVVRQIAHRIAVMYLGRIVEEGATDQLLSNPRHPYTVALLSAVPEPDPTAQKDRIVLRGDLPSPSKPPPGCPFHTRCFHPLKNERCATEVPLLRPVQGVVAACHYAESTPAPSEVAGVTTA